MRNSKCLRVLKLSFTLLLVFNLVSCTKEDDKEKCKTETICFDGGSSCIERPINIEDCIDNREFDNTF